MNGQKEAYNFCLKNYSLFAINYFTTYKFEKQRKAKSE